jgi:hypothetical protein
VLASSNYLPIGLLGALMLIPSLAWADNVESALMPGQVIEGHAKWEEDCTKCHKRFDKAAQNTLCQDCHKDVRKDIEQKQGSHGRFKELRECKECHTEHKGRTENIAPITEQTFDHERTDFPLKGAHANAKKVECKACHKPKFKYRDAPSDCYSCHKKDDKHKGKVGNACADCHTDRNWKEIRFDHDKTRYKLRNKHVEVPCKDCHANDRYKQTPMDCYSCHKKDDKHKGQEGTKCEECHDDQSWKKSPFDHNKSRFPLMGKHAKTECKKCHLTPAFKDAPMDCYSCHKKDDKHKGAYGEKCETCHAENDWKTITFDHDLHSKYPLRGRHIMTKCESCHTGHLYKDKTPADCNACHKKDDKHKGQFTEKCERCHTERDWRVLLFEHDHDTKYPLRGKHRTTTCESCHTGRLYQDKTPTTCYACHKNVDVHGRRLGTECQDCHSLRDWKLWDFDHDTRTQFKLDGGHKERDCYACHTERMDKKVKSSTSCVSCHKKDDKHDGSFGPQCDRCHETTLWKTIKPGIRMFRSQ